MFKKCSLIIILIIALTVFTGCSRDEDPLGLGSTGPGTKPFRVGVVLSLPSPGKQDINANLISGAKKAYDQLGIDYKVLNNGDLVNDVESLKYFAENEYDLVIAGGPEMAKALDQVAKGYSDTKFVIIDRVLDHKNVTSLLFDDEQGGFLAGYTAAGLTKTGVLGFVGGSQLDEEAARFQSGFLKGIQFANNAEGKRVKTYISYAGVFADATLKPEQGKKLAQSQFSNGADLVFEVAGKTGDGVYSAATEARRYVISNDPVKAQKFQWNSYAVLEKHYGNALFGIIRLAHEGKLKNGIITFGVSNNGIGLRTFQAVSPEITEKLKSVQTSLAKGQTKLEKIVIANDIQLKVPEPAPVLPGQGAGNAGGGGQNASPRTNSPGGNTNGGTRTQPNTDQTGGNQSGGNQSGTNQSGNQPAEPPDNSPEPPSNDVPIDSDISANSAGD